MFITAVCVICLIKLRWPNYTIGFNSDRKLWQDGDISYLICSRN